MSKVFKEPARMQDLIITEIDPRYCRVSGKFAAGVATGTYQPGLLLTGNATAGFTPTANSFVPASAVLLSRAVHTLASTQEYLVMRHGPSVLTRERLVNGDGVAITDTQVAQMMQSGLLDPGIKVIDASELQIWGEPVIN